MLFESQVPMLLIRAKEHGNLKYICDKRMLYVNVWNNINDLSEKKNNNLWYGINFGYGPFISSSVNYLFNNLLNLNQVII